MIEQEYKGPFLNQFSHSHQRWYVTTLFVWAFRGGNWAEKPTPDGATNVKEMLERVAKSCEQVLKHSYFDRELHEYILSILQDQETKNFAKFVGERQKGIKPTKVTDHQQKAMSAKPISDKQTWMLKTKLKYRGKMPTTKLEASNLISKLLEKTS